MKSSLDKFLGPSLYLVAALTIVGVSVVVGLGWYIDYSKLTSDSIHLLALYNCFLLFFEVLGALFFFALSIFFIFSFYYQLRYYTSSFYAAVSLWLILGFAIMYILPGVIYMNNFMLLAQVSALHWGEIHMLVPEISFTDFMVTMMNQESSTPPVSKIPPMGDHIIVAGLTEDKDPYTCFSVKNALNKTLKPGLLSSGAQVSKKYMGVPDAFCFGNVEPHPDDVGGKTK